MTIAENLPRLRKAKGLSQKALADRAGVSQQSISRLETGMDLTSKHLPDLARAIGVTVYEIDESFRPDPETAPASLRVPIIDWISAGQLSAHEGITDFSDFPTIDAVDLATGDWIALKVEGDSMDRISPPESIILVNRKDKRLVANACYVVADQYGNATYKRYRPNPDRFEPVSTNSVHEPIFPDNDVPVIGRVRRTILDM